MPPINTVVEARDSSVTSGSTSNLKTGLTPTWAAFRTYVVGGSPAAATYTDEIPGGTPSAKVPAIVGVASGAAGYSFVYDAATNGEAVGVIDFGSGLANPSDRFQVVQLTKDSGLALHLVSDVDGASLATSIAAILAAVQSGGAIVTVSDNSATSTSFKVAGAPSGLSSGAYADKHAYVMNGAGIGLVAKITASGAPASGLVQLTIASGLTAAPDNGATIWIL